MLLGFEFAGDVLSGTSGAGEHYTGVLEEWAGGPTWWNERVFVLFTIAVVVLLPLISFRHVGTLSNLVLCFVFWLHESELTKTIRRCVNLPFKRRIGKSTPLLLLSTPRIFFAPLNDHGDEMIIRNIQCDLFTHFLRAI